MQNNKEINSKIYDILQSLSYWFDMYAEHYTGSLNNDLTKENIDLLYKETNKLQNYLKILKET